MQKSFASLLFSALAAAILLAGCAKPPEMPRILWPPPPDTPRLEFIGAYASQDDFPKTGPQAFTEGIVGKPPLALFKSPFGIVADARGKVYVSDMHDKNVRVYDLKAHTVNYLFKHPVLDTPFGMVMDGAGNIYVADGARGKVMVFSADGRPLFSFGSSEVLTKPAYLALNERLERIYVSDGAGHRIVVFDMRGKYLFSFGRLGGGPSDLHSPQGLAIDAQDHVFVADMLNARVQVFDADGRYLYLFGERGDLPSQFEAPKDLAFDSDGNLYAIDSRRPLLYTYTPDGRLLLTTGGSSRTGHKLGFTRPTSIYIDSSDRIYVADMLNRRFSVWQYLSEAYLKEHPITDEDIRRIEELQRR
jgi:DNA-binding beta-propeller fold protein YncE